MTRNEDLRDVIESVQERKNGVKKSIDYKQDEIERLEQEIQRKQIQHSELSQTLRQLEQVYDSDDV